MVYPLAEKYLRISGKTVEELAEEVGTSRSTMYYKLNGGSDMSVEINETSRWICAITQPRLLLFLALC